MHVAAWFVGAALAVMPACASAHVTVWPKESAAGAREKYEIRVPNEKQVNTVGVELRFPNGVRVTSLEQVPGWTITIDRDGAGNIVGAQWRGQLSPRQFVEFGLLAVNPPGGSPITWSAVQVYADGSSVSWSGAEGSKTPAPRVIVR